MLTIIRQFENNTYRITEIDSDGNSILSAVLPSLTGTTINTKNRLLYLIPGTQAHILTIETPKMSANELKQAIPNLLEEKLADDIDTLHFVIGAVNHNNCRCVCVIKKNVWEPLLALLKELDLQPDLIIPDYLALPLTENNSSLLIEKNTAFFRSGAQEGFAIEAALLDVVLENDRPQKTYTGELEALINSDDLERSTPLNLLKIKKRRSKNKVSYWRWCGLSAASFVILLFLGQLLLYAGFTVKNVRLNKQILARYQQFFPGDRSLTDPKLRIERLLKSYELASNPFVTILKRIAAVKTKLSGVLIQEIGYAHAAETVNLIADSRSDLTTFNKALLNSGLVIKNNQTLIKNKKMSELITVGIS